MATDYDRTSALAGVDRDAARAAAKVKRDKRAAHRASHNGLDVLASRHPAYLSDIDKIKRGSLKSAIKMACIDCSGSRAEAVRCTAIACPLYLFRPGADGDMED